MAVTSTLAPRSVAPSRALARVCRLETVTDTVPLTAATAAALTPFTAVTTFCLESAATLIAPAASRAALAPTVASEAPLK